ncbi:TonB-dependent siderophore receptor [Dyella koreensis]|uniref:TonB-dependent siderophore receptor n=1 Tax=Dyella koreensis TaxID=311235 RepID=UPI0036236533
MAGHAHTRRRSLFSHRRTLLALSCLLTFSAFATDRPATEDDAAEAANKRRSAAKAEHVTDLEGVVATASVDRNSTEGTGSYTTPVASGATRLPLSLRETPQSVSVITRAQMDDFGLNNVNDVLARSTGISVEKIETDRTYYGARGFDITNFLTDGLGLPFANGQQEGDIDTAIYDHIEVLRGANGLLSFTGNPSATINFVRKRPTADLQGSVGTTVGSWNNRRLDGDISGPLNQSASVRGRLVVANQDTDSYLDRYSQHKKIAAGMLEADLGANTLLSAGVSWQKNAPDSPMWGALPLYNSDGTPTNYRRSTSTSTDWAHWDSANTQSYVSLSHDFDNGWNLKAALNYRRITNDSELFYTYGTPDAATGLGLYSYPSRYTSTEKQYYVDMYASGPFTLGGREHRLVLGVNAGKSDVDQLSGYSSDIGTPLPALWDWTGHYPKPSFDASFNGAQFHLRRRSAYATARWNLTDDLKLITGASLTYIHSTGQNYGVPHAYEKTKSTPFAGAVYDLNANYSLYASYAKIFNPQTEVDINNRVLDPVTGNNLEAGIKGAWMDQRLNASFAVFRSHQNNYAESVGINPVTAQSYYRGINATSTGYEFDIAGSLTKDWEASAGFTQLRIQDDQDHNVRTYVPRRTLRITTTYRLPWLTGLKVGGSLRWQDKIVRDQGALDTQGREIFTRQGSYALLGLMANYSISPSWSATLNVDNLTNRKYIASLYWAQGYYGAPTNWQLNVTYRF